MQIKNSDARYGAIAQAFHWSIVALIVTQFILALQAGDAQSLMQKARLLTTHKSVGMTIFGLAVLRLLWRLINFSPAPPKAPAWQNHLANTVHWSLYALILATPLVGWMMSSAKNYTVSYFGFFSFPNLVGPDEALFEQFKLLHKVLAYSISCLAILHIVGALKHHFWNKDNVLRRMLPLRLKP